MRASVLRFTLLAAALCGCASEPGWLDTVEPIPDPTLTDTPPEAPFEAGQRRDVGDAQASFVEGLHNDFFDGVLMPGDLDGDGIGDLLTWSTLHAPPEIAPCGEEWCPGFAQLEVSVIYGSTTLGARGRLEPDARIRSFYVHNLTFTVDRAGDVNGDGLADFVIGVGTVFEEQGNAFVVFGGPRLSGVVDVRDVAPLVRETGTGTRFGQVAGIGDVDGDGLDDIAIGAPEGSVSGVDATGRLYLYYGRAEAPPARRSERDADASLLPIDGIHQFGDARGAGDVDGDGFADFLVSVVDPFSAYQGVRAWWLVRGRASRFSGAQDVASIATRIDAVSVRALGDLDGDGRTELGVTVETGDRDAFVLAGRAEWPAELDPTADAGTWVDPGRTLTRPAWHAGGDVFPAGDVDGDGHLDFAYGDPAYRAPDDDTPRGAVYLFRGPIDTGSGALSLASATAFLGQDWRSANGSRVGYDILGSVLASGSDLNGDGIDDLAIGGETAAGGGRVYVWLGRSAEAD